MTVARTAPRPLLLLANRLSGRQRGGELLPRVAAALVAGGFAPTAELVGSPLEARELAADAARSGRWAAVAVLAGDGTVRGAAAGLLGSDVALAALPGGTTNVVALALGFSARPLAAAGELAAAVERSIDVGLCDGDPFLMQVSAGLDARILGRVTSRMKSRFGRLGVLLTGLDTLRTYRFPEIRVETERGTFTATHAAVCNLPLYGGAFRLAPTGSWEDGHLDLVLYCGRGRRASLRYHLGILRQRHTELAECSVTQVEEAAILGGPGVTVQVDGDPLSSAPPARVRLARERLRVLAIPGRAA